MSNTKKLDKNRTAYYAARDLYWQTFQAAFPVGATIEWDHGGHKQRGVVTHKGSRDIVVAENERTGKTVQVSDYQITGKYR